MKVLHHLKLHNIVLLTLLMMFYPVVKVCQKTALMNVVKMRETESNVSNLTYMYTLT